MEGGRSTRPSREGESSKCSRVGAGAATARRCSGSSPIDSRETGILKLIHLNADSIVNKMDLLQARVSELKPDIIAITESWTHGDISDATLKIEGYDLIGRRDRTDTLKGRGGGILLYSSLPCVYVNSLHKSEQILHATIPSKDKRSEDIQIHVFYRSPNATEEMTDEVIKYIDDIPANSVLVGDFNYPNVDW